MARHDKGDSGASSSTMFKAEQSPDISCRYSWTVDVAEGRAWQGWHQSSYEKCAQATEKALRRHFKWRLGRETISSEEKRTRTGLRKASSVIPGQRPRCVELVEDRILDHWYLARS
eukprot:3353133-Rhodomonas_salina.1